MKIYCFSHPQTQCSYFMYMYMVIRYQPINRTKRWHLFSNHLHLDRWMDRDLEIVQVQKFKSCFGDLHCFVKSYFEEKMLLNLMWQENVRFCKIKWKLWKSLYSSTQQTNILCNFHIVESIIIKFRLVFESCSDLLLITYCKG